MSLLHLVYAYFVGGVTFIPAAIVLFVYLHPKKAEERWERPLKAAQVEESRDSGLTAFKQGWIVVTHEELESQDDISGKSDPVGEVPDSKSAYSSLYKLVTNTKVAVRQENEESDPENAPRKEEETKEGFGKERNGIKEDTFAFESKELSEDSPMAGNTASPAPAKKHRYYAVLKHGNLFLYKNERMQDVKHVIVLLKHMVSLWPRNLSEASLFTKYSLIALLKADWSRPRRHSDYRREVAGSGNWSRGRITVQDILDPASGLPAPPGAIFIYTDYNTDKEDWYFALIRATKEKEAEKADSVLDPAVYAETLHFSTANSIKLIQALYSSEGQLQTKWINSILGRLFLSLQETDLMRNYLILKIEKKLNKIKTPGFLDKFQILQVDAGSSAPLISYPVLKEINPEGNLLVSFDVHYTGGLSMQLATKVNINLGLRFKTREVDVLLSITFEKISGPMLLRMKAPPSTRIWYTFENEPQMSIKIEPVISSRLMSYGVITNSIEKKFKDAIKESLVFPHWDDVVFYHSSEEVYRGGLWDKLGRPEKEACEKTEKNGKGEVPQKEGAELRKEEGLQKEKGQGLKTETESYDDDCVSVFSDSSFSSATPTRARLSSTLNDISRRLRKPKSASTLGVDETSILSDGSEIQRASPEEEAAITTSTIRKIGSWYSKPTKTPSSPLSAGPGYVAPEMISNRRPRKQSLATLHSDSERAEKPESGYDFGANLLDGRISEAVHGPLPLDVEKGHRRSSTLGDSDFE